MSHTCVSCGLLFNDVASQRDHMKSEWHRYNLKRRVAQLPAVDEETFTSKIASLSLLEGSADLNHKKQMTKKELRRKEREALQARRSELLAMKKAIEGKLSTSTDIDNSEIVSGEVTEVSESVEPAKLENLSPDELEEMLINDKLANSVEIPITTCLFCPDQKKCTFPSVDDNIKHMFKHHGLYLPEAKYLIDKEGLIRYLGEKIGLGNMCLVCNYQGRDVSSVREHMQAKRHMKIPYESEVEKLEISDFYDFSSTYELESQILSGQEDENDWEDVSSDDGESDVEDIDNQILDTGTELVLPSGAVIGHRSLARYYRQNFPPERILSEGQGTVIAAETRHFLASRSKQELATQKRAWGRQKKREDINDRRAAKFINNQPHFRDPLLQ